MASRVRLPTCTHCKTVVYEVNKKLLCNACRRHIRENGFEPRINVKSNQRRKYILSREMHTFVLPGDDDDDIPASQDPDQYGCY